MQYTTLYDVGMHDVSIIRPESKPTDHTFLEHLPTSLSINHLSKVSIPVSVLKIDLLWRFVSSPKKKWIAKNPGFCESKAPSWPRLPYHPHATWRLSFEALDVRKRLETPGGS